MVYNVMMFENGKYAISLGLHANVTIPDAQINLRKKNRFSLLYRRPVPRLPFERVIILSGMFLKAPFPNGRIILDFICFAVYLN